MSEKEEKARKLLEKMREERGWVPDYLKFLILEAPDWVERYNLFFTYTFNMPALPAKYKHLVWCATSLMDQNDLSLRVHAREALNAGAKPEELLETLFITVFHSGIGKLLNKIHVIEEVLKEFKEKQKI